jgi:hypothetical protein
LYVSVKRAWEKGSKVLFVRKADSFLGSGIVADVRQLEEMDAAERELCVERNWYARILFSKLARFHPPISIEQTPLASQNPLALHGSEISPEVASKIEELASVKIIT